MLGNDSSDELESTNSNSSDSSSSSYSPVFHVQEQLTSDEESNNDDKSLDEWTDDQDESSHEGEMSPKKQYEEL